jgi:hypothetical protein
MSRETKLKLDENVKKQQKNATVGNIDGTEFKLGHRSQRSH